MTKALKAAVAMIRQPATTGPPPPVTASDWTSKSLAARYALSVAVIAGASALHGVLAYVFGPMPPFLTFYPAVLVVALIAGGGPGALAILLSALAADVSLLPPHGSITIGNTADLIALIIFMATSGALCAVAERIHQARWLQMVAARQMQLLHVTMASVHEGVITTDIEGRLIFLNNTAEMLTGTTWGDVEGQALESVFTLVNAKTGEPITDVINTVLREGKLDMSNSEIEFRSLRRRDAFPIEINGAPIRAEDGTLYGAVLTFRDCTERQLSQREVRRLLEASQAEKDWLSQLLNSINEEVYFTSTQRRFTFVNPAARNEFGLSTDGGDVATLLTSLSVFRADGTPRPIEEAPPLRALAGEIVRDEEQMVRSPRTGELRHRQVSAAPVRDAKGQIIGSVSVARDITDRKRQENALREADYRKNVFLATLSHELRNPLAPIRTAARLLESETLSLSDLRRCRSIISRQVAQMASLLDDLLDIARLSRGELTLKKEHVELQQVLDAAIESAQHLVTAKHHRLQLDLLPAPLMLEVDPVRLAQIVTNLLANAAKYTDPYGEISLEVRLEHEGIIIAVRDNGIGLDEVMRQSVFEMFFQAAANKDRREGGLGIGLALVKALVELHGGTIAAQSDGRELGSTFTVTLPRSVIVEKPESESISQAAQRSDPLPRNVLIADDNVDGAEALALLFQTLGNTVHVANDGAAALELAAKLNPDISVLDIGMPGLTGYEVARRIRREEWGKHMTLIALTGWGQEEDRREAMGAGFDYHITKPVDPARLEQIIASIP